MTASALKPLVELFRLSAPARIMPDTPSARHPKHAADSQAGSGLDAATGPAADPAAGRPVGAPEPAIQNMISAIAGGDTSAFAVFYEQWFDRGVDMVFMLTRRDESFCLDVVQDAMMRAIRSLVPRLGIRARPDLDRWMTRVLHTTAIDHLRKESRRRGREARAVGGKGLPGRSGDDTKDAGPGGGIEGVVWTDRAEVDERIAWIRERLEEIDSGDRQLVVSHFGHARSVAASGAAAGMTPGAATGRLTRLLARLRAAAKEMFHDDV